MRQNVDQSDSRSRRQELLGLLGDLPDRSHPVTASTLWSERRDPCYQPLSDFNYDGAAAAPTLWDGAELQECFFRHADLTGKDLVIAQQSKGEPKKA